MAIRKRGDWWKWWVWLWLRLPFLPQQLIMHLWHDYFLRYESDESGEWKRIA